MAIEEIPSPLHPGMCVSLALFENVKNCQELKNRAMEGKISACLLNPSLVVDKYQVMVAGIQAIQHDQNQGRVTRVLQTELLYCLSPTKNISDAFRKFGMSGSDTRVLVTELHPAGESHMNEVRETVDGDLVDLSRLNELADTAAVKKVYKVPEPELKVGSLLEAVVGRIACKDIMA